MAIIKFKYKEMKHYIEAGMLIRRTVRRFLLLNNIKFIEDKGFIDSVFYFDCTKKQYDSIVKVFIKFKQ